MPRSTCPPRLLCSRLYRNTRYSRERRERERRATRIYAPPSPPAAAIDQVDAWLESPSVTLLAESERYWPALKSALQDGRVNGQLVHDARVAALCLLHGVRELWTADRDFGRFASLAVRNPLVG